MMTLKVLLVAKSFTKGGSSSGALNLKNALEAAGANVVTIDGFVERRKNFTHIPRFLERVLERVFFDSETHCIKLGPSSVDLYKLYKKYSPDVIQLCDISANTISFKQLPKIKCPVIHRLSDFWPYHGASHYAMRKTDSSDFATNILRYTLYSGRFSPDAYVAPSYWLYDSLKIAIRSQTNKYMIRNAVKIPNEYCYSNIDNDKKFRFGFISNNILDPRKGFDNIVPFLEHIAKCGYTVDLHIFGRIKNQELPAVANVNIFNHGTFGRDELYTVFKNMDILLCPSLLDNSPNVLCEALSYGRPVIAQSGTGMDSYVCSEFGYLFDYKLSIDDSLQTFLNYCLEIKGNYSSYSASATEYAKSELLPKYIGGQYIKLYAELLRIKAKED